MDSVVDQPTSVALVGPQLNGPTAVPISTAVVWFATTHRSTTHICRAPAHRAVAVTPPSAAT